MLRKWLLYVIFNKKLKKFQFKIILISKKQSSKKKSLISFNFFMFGNNFNWFYKKLLEIEPFESEPKYLWVQMNKLFIEPDSRFCEPGSNI